MKNNRRVFIEKSLITVAGMTAGFNAFFPDNLSESCMLSNFFPSDDAFKISLFSKHLQWLDFDKMADAIAATGFDGADLTVRPGGHVEPENVERDLPKAVEAFAKRDKKIYMITSSINSADDPVTVKIIKTCSELGIKRYRMDWSYYDNAKTVEENIAIIKTKLSKLAELNERYSISGEYQNHSGIAANRVYFGGAIWDIALVLKEINSKWLGVQYDVYHATVEGANAWPIGLKFICPFIRSIVIKDFEWINTKSESVPLGKGRVDFKQYFSILKEQNIAVPVSVHLEYPLGGAENGAKKITVGDEIVFNAMKKDINVLKNYLKEAELRS